MGWVVGIDIGGTFTDLYARRTSPPAELLLKVPSVPDDPAAGVMNVLRAAAARLGQPLAEFIAEVDHLGHASTIGTNLVVERKGARTGLLTTAGFPDSLALQRLNLGRLTFDLNFRRPPSLVPRDLVREIPERVDRRGRARVALDENAVVDAVEDLVRNGVEAVAVAYLWSFRNPAHERRTAELIEERFPDLWVSLSHVVVPLSGEYERTATTVIDAYIGSRVSAYLRDLGRRLDGDERRQVFVMQTLGGTSPLSHVADRPVRTLNSGPVSGAAAAAAIGRDLSRPNVIAGDVGGTSFDVSLTVDGAPLRAQGSTLLGFHTLISTVDVHAIGAGGGSIARAIGERLQVGPDSAGALPGPACYGRGGTEPTVTDALVALGIIDADRGLAEGSFALDAALATAVIDERLAQPLGVGTTDAALSIYEVVNAHMADAIRVSTVRRGHDPREFPLLIFGGAGPAHAWALAEELEIPEVIVPAAGSVLSAYGLVSADVLFEEVRSEPMAAPFDGEQLAATLRELAARAHADAAASGAETPTARFSVDARYVGQLSDLTVPVEPGWLDAPAAMEERIAEAFANEYERVFGLGSRFAGAPLMLTRFRAELVGQPTEVTRREELVTPSAAAPVETRTVTLSRSHRNIACGVFAWPELEPGSTVDGPALIVSPLTTCVVGPGQRAWIDGFCNVRIDNSTGGGPYAESR